MDMVEGLRDSSSLCCNFRRTPWLRTTIMHGNWGSQPYGRQQQNNTQNCGIFVCLYVHDTTAPTEVRRFVRVASSVVHVVL